jgi:hypothetical protein
MDEQYRRASAMARTSRRPGVGVGHGVGMGSGVGVSNGVGSESGP